MWLVERFAANGRPTGVGNMLKYFLWLRQNLKQNLLLVHPGPFVRAIAGVGRTGSPAMPGWDHRNCVSVSLVCPLFSL
jgi:hypothetical protein